MGSEEKNNLMELVKRGDKAAFEKVYDSFSPALFGVICKILPDQEVAEDALQDSFVKIWTKIHYYDPSKGTPFTWMLNICRNTALDKLRKINKSGEKIQNDANDVYESSVEQHVDAIGLDAYLKKLPEEQQKVIDYIYFKGYTQAEASEELGLPLGTIKSRTRIAIRDLKKYLTSLIL